LIKKKSSWFEIRTADKKQNSCNQEAQQLIKKKSGWCGSKTADKKKTADQEAE
jgi:hypothetical protein